MNAHIHGTASEWFSTGITLHELLTGRRPFEAGRLQQFRQCTRFPEHGQDYQPNYRTEMIPGPGRATAPSKSQRACMQMRTSHVSGGGGTEYFSESDALWPEHLYQCDYLSPACKDFVRALLVPDVKSY